MKSTITFTATVVLDKGGSITVTADEVPIAGADLFDLVENMFEQVPPGIVAAMGMPVVGSTSLVPRSGPLPGAAAPKAPIDADGKVEPVPEVLKAAPKDGSNPGKRVAGDAAPGTCAHKLMTAVADEGGIYEGNLSDLATLHGTGNKASAVAMASQLNRAGLLDAVPRTGPVKLTAAGWAAIGRAEPKVTPPSPLAAVPDPPKVPDLGPIEKRPFDPDRVRQQQANAL